MPVLHISLKDGERHIPFAPGLSVREFLDITDIKVRSACGGVGACGLCRVRISAGTGGDPTANELINLSPDQIQRGRFVSLFAPEFANTRKYMTMKGLLNIQGKDKVNE